MHSLQVTKKPKGDTFMLLRDGKQVPVFFPAVGTMLCRDTATGKLVWVERKSG